MPAIVSLIALLLGSAIVLIGNGLQGLLIPVRADIEGFATSEIGLIASAYSTGFIVGCVVNPRIIRRVGHIRSFSIFAAIAGAVILCHALILHSGVWFALRLISGVCFSGLFTVIESWLNERASPENRGQIFGLYLFVNLSSITAGMLLLVTGDAAGFELFAVTAIAVLLALVPVCLTTTKAPAPVADVKLRLVRLFRLSPVGVFGCFGVGLANGAFVGLAPIFGSSVGMDATGIAFFGAASVIGGAFGQYPIGRVSDRMDRRRVVVATCIFAVGVEVVFALIALGWLGQAWEADTLHWVLIALSGALGFFIFPLYGLSVAHTNDFAVETSFVEVSSGLLLTWGIGATIGPIAGSLLMSWFGSSGLFGWLALAHICLAIFAVYRMAQRDAPSDEDKATYAPTFGQRVTPTAYGLHPEADGLEDLEEPEELELDDEGGFH